ncbi:MAG: hypothetical protein JOS17DRAFT_794637 [Linnemannia elongata]|nr:MAG: hypothetical protein JOS17DRAFT_794637 [Linnemannia elongata]
MCLIKTALLTIAFFAAATSAQWVEDAPPACQSCLLNARNTQVPSCKVIPADPRGPKNSKMLLPARICQCGAADSDAWIQSCAKPEVCDVITTNVLKTAYRGVKIGCVFQGVSDHNDKDAVVPSTSSSAIVPTTATGASDVVATVPTTVPSSLPPSGNDNGASSSLLTRSSVAITGVILTAAGAFAALLSLQIVPPNRQKRSSPRLQKHPPNPQTGQMTREARICQCGAASNVAWITGCIKPDACDARTEMALKHAYAEVNIGCIYSGLSSVAPSSE